MKLDSTLIQAALASAELSINKALAYDPATLQKVQTLSNHGQNPKLLALHIRQPALSIYVRFDQQLQLQSHSETQADTQLSGELSAFMNLASQQDKQAALMQSDIQIQGSSQLAMALADIMAELDIDFEAMVSELTGPVVAHVLGKNLRSIGNWFKQTGHKLKQDTVEFVRDERKMAVHKTEGEIRFGQIHKLKLDTERLEARIQRLQQNLTGQGK